MISAVWSAQRQRELINQLTGFWAQEEWDMRDCPLLDGQSVGYRIRFTCRFTPINHELKYAVWQKFQRGEWAPQYASRAHQLQVLMDWLNTSAICTQSLVEQDLAKLLVSFRTYLTTKGIAQKLVGKRLDGNQTIRTYHKDDPTLSALRQLYRAIEDAYDLREEYEKPIWDVRKLGVSVNDSRSDYTLNFTHLAPEWLQTAGKRFIRYSLATNSVSECQNRLLALTWFGRFLVSHPPIFLPHEIDRPVILKYLGYLRASSLSNRTRKMYLIGLRTFLEVAAREGWIPVSAQRLIYSEDIPRPVEPVPRYIPEDVIQQLNRHLDDLPSEIQRMVLIVQECGMRISELCTLRRDCLLHDTRGDAFLRYYQGKMQKEHTIPVTSEVVAVIGAQQQTVEATWGDRTPYLFPRRNGEPFKQRTFVEALNKLAYHHQITNAAGELFRFQSHQF
ncbi:MAG: tyrosine-type recombinase/integrase, partial [Sulfobacillus sp.]